MSGESEEDRVRAFEDASNLPVEDDIPLTRDEIKSMQEANTSFLLRQMQIMLDNCLKKANDPVGPSIPNPSKGAVDSTSASGGANASPTVDASTKTKNGMGEYSNSAPPNDYGGRIIQHPHINSHGPPPKLDIPGFVNWQAEMKSHICSASTQLWRVIRDGYYPVNPNNLQPKRRGG